MNTISTSELTSRELQILESIVRSYILTGLPTGSRMVARDELIGLSPATVRNAMMDLEEKGYITHPHTSAGRIPTDKGYRFYVDRLMQLVEPSLLVKNEIKTHLTNSEPSDLHMVLEATSRALAKATHQLGVIVAPKLREGLFRHMHIVGLEGNKYVLHLTIDSGFVKTMVADFATSIGEERLNHAVAIMNNRFAGKKLSDVTISDSDISLGIEEADIGIIRLFVPSITRMISDSREEQVITDGASQIVLTPDFFDRERANTIIEILAQKKLLVHLFGNEPPSKSQVIVSIGGENEDGHFHSLSIVKTSYRVGNLSGTLGIVGPKRMPYELLVSTVDYTARLLEDMYH